MLLVILAALGFTAYYFRSYISAYMLSRNNSSEDLEQLRKDAQSAEKLLENYENINVRDLTDEEQQKLADNELTEDEAIDLILGMLDGSKPAESIENPPESTPPADITTDVADTPSNLPTSDAPQTPSTDKTETNPIKDLAPPQSEQPPQDNTPQTPQPTTPPQDSTVPPQSDKKDELKEVNEQVARLVAKLYVTKAQANNEINNLDNSVKAEYVAECNALSPEERKAQKMTIKAKYLKKAAKVLAEWEKTYDANVEAIISEIETLLKGSGQDTTLAQSLRTAYNDEKTYIKAYYLNRVSDDD